LAACLVLGGGRLCLLLAAARLSLRLLRGPKKKRGVIFRMSFFV
jgi:hypothetical protein